MFATSHVTLYFLISTLLHHSAVGMHQLNVAKPELANRSFVMSVEPDATTAQEPLSVVQVAPQLEVPDHRNAAKTHGHDAMQGKRHNMERLRAEVPHDESIREKEAGALLVATAVEAGEAGRLRAGHGVRSDDWVGFVLLCVLLFLLAVCIVAMCNAMLNHRRSDAREGTTMYRGGYQASASSQQNTTMYRQGYQASTSPQQNISPAAGLLTSPLMSSAPFQATQTMSETPLSSTKMPVADMRLILPTPLTIPHHVEGVDFRVDGVWTPWQGGNRAQIHNMAKEEEVACLHQSETDYGSGILFVLSPNSPIAWLDTKQLRSGQAQEVAVFGSSDDNWSAMAAPAAIVKATRDNSDFVMMMDGQELLMIYMNEQKQLSSIAKDGKVIAQFQISFGPGYLLRIIGGADAGLVLIATVCCLQMIDHRKKLRPGSSALRPQ